MRLMHRATAVLVTAFFVGLMATAAYAQVVAEGNGVIIKSAAGGHGPYTISRDGGRTWAPYPIRPLPKPLPKVVVPPPPAPTQVACHFYLCGGRVIAVPAPGVAPGRFLGTGTISAGKVDPKTNVVVGQ